MADGVVVADSDLVIDFLRGAAPGADVVQGLLERGGFRVTAVTAFELRVGGDFDRRRVKIEALLAHRTLPLDAMSALLAGDVFSHLRSTGRGLALQDALVAGICIRYDLPLATRNIRHFERVPGLRLVPWPVG